MNEGEPRRARRRRTEVNGDFNQKGRSGLKGEPITIKEVDVTKLKPYDNPGRGINPETNQCMHRWVLGQPHDGITHGVCRHCGEGKDFHDQPDRFGLSAPRKNQKTDSKEAEPEL